MPSFTPLAHLGRQVDLRVVFRPGKHGFQRHHIRWSWGRFLHGRLSRIKSQSTALVTGSASSLWSTLTVLRQLYKTGTEAGGGVTAHDDGDACCTVAAEFCRSPGHAVGVAVDWNASVTSGWNTNDDCYCIRDCRPLCSPPMACSIVIIFGIPCSALDESELVLTARALFLSSLQTFTRSEKASNRATIEYICSFFVASRSSTLICNSGLSYEPRNALRATMCKSIPASPR